MPDPKHAQARGRRGGGVEGQNRPIIGTTADQRSGERQESDENQDYEVAPDEATVVAADPPEGPVVDSPIDADDHEAEDAAAELRPDQ